MPAKGKSWKETYEEVKAKHAAGKSGIVYKATYRLVIGIILTGVFVVSLLLVLMLFHLAGC
jgi:hypothetical protein